MSSNQDWFAHFKQAGFIWEYRDNGPHASYEMATKHAAFYFNTDATLSHPEQVTAIGRLFADACRAESVKPDWVASYATTVSSGLVLAAKIAELLSARFGYVDLRDKICRFHPRDGENILLVTDDIHSGKSLKQMIELVERAGGKVIPLILTMANFSGSPAFQDKKIISLFDHAVETYNPTECPLCQKGSPALNARQQWDELMKGRSS